MISLGEACLWISLGSLAISTGVARTARTTKRKLDELVRRP